MKKYAMIGGLAGLINGLVGGGGGAVLVPLLQRWGKLPQGTALASSVAVILPLCCVSVGIYAWQGNLDWLAGLPYVMGGAVGGFLGGKLFPKAKVSWLRKGFGLLMLLGGVRCLLW